MAKWYQVAYRVGGTDNCRWLLADPVINRELAEQQALRIQRMGYKTIIRLASEWASIGLPEGWEAI